MRKIILILSTILVSFTIHAQIDLYKGITSGITPDEYLEYCESHPDIIHQTTDIKGRTYIIIPSFQRGKLTILTFTSRGKYDDHNYYPEIINSIVELKSTLTDKLGEPILDRNLKPEEIANGNFESTQLWQSGSIVAVVYVAKRVVNDANMYDVKMYIGDWDFITY